MVKSVTNLIERGDFVNIDRMNLRKSISRKINLSRFIHESQLHIHTHTQTQYTMWVDIALLRFLLFEQKNVGGDFL